VAKAPQKEKKESNFETYSWRNGKGRQSKLQPERATMAVRGPGNWGGLEQTPSIGATILEKGPPNGDPGNPKPKKWVPPKKGDVEIRK